MSVCPAPVGRQQPARIFETACLIMAACIAELRLATGCDCLGRQPRPTHTDHHHHHHHPGPTDCTFCSPSCRCSPGCHNPCAVTVSLLGHPGRQVGKQKRQDEDRLAAACSCCCWCCMYCRRLPLLLPVLLHLLLPASPAAGCCWLLAAGCCWLLAAGGRWCWLLLAGSCKLLLAATYSCSG